jgi:hypothetical protein
VNKRLKKTVMTDPRCACGAAVVGTVSNGFRHGKYRCTPISSPHMDEFDTKPEPNWDRIADKIVGCDPDDLGD